MPAAHFDLRKKNVSKADTVHTQHEFLLGEAFSLSPYMAPQIRTWLETDVHRKKVKSSRNHREFTCT
jgi:hypothetical protein